MCIFIKQFKKKDNLVQVFENNLENSSITERLLSLGLNKVEYSSVRAYIDGNYDPEFSQNFLHALSKKDWTECDRLVNSIPSDIKIEISKRSDIFESIFKKIGELLSLFSDFIKTAFKNASELAEREPEKAQYIFGLALIGIIMAYLFGKKR